MENPTEASVHGHEIIHLIHDSNPPLTRAGLEKTVHARFGPEARFHTCSAGGMTLDQLLTFLLARRKIVEINGSLRAAMENVCEDGQ